MPSKHFSRAVVAAFLAAALAGCAPPPAPSIGHYLSDPADLGRIRRVVFVELDWDSTSADVSPQLTQALFQAIQSKRRFRIDILPRTDARYAELPLDPQGSHTLEQLAEIRRVLGCEAILFGSARSFQPFPRMRVELYLRLLDLRSGALVWGVDHTWDSTDKTTEKRIRRYYEDNLRGGYEPARWRIVMVSPQQFSKFVACEVAGTLIGDEQRNPRAGFSGRASETLRKLSEIPKKLAKVAE